MTNYQLFNLWLFGWPLLGIAVGLAGIRWRRVKQVLVWPTAAYSTLLFIYGLFRGGPNECIENAAGTSFTCHPTAAFADLNVLGLVVIVAVTVLSFAPIAAWRARTRTPSVVAAALLLALLIFFTFGLLLWVPAASAVLAAAIAGPPHQEKGAPDGEPPTDQTEIRPKPRPGPV